MSGTSTPQALVFVDDLETPQLDDHDRHHLQKVLRLRTGALIAVSDGNGATRNCRLGPELEPVSPVAVAPRLEPQITVGFALVKGQRPEWIAQKLTEAGVDVIVPFSAHRSVVRWDAAKAGSSLERLRKVVREAAMQCRRSRLPRVEPVTNFATVASGADVALANPHGGPLTLEHPTVLIGPEGGWSEAELDGRPTVGLGANILRSETAAVAAGILLCGLRSGVVAPALRRTV